MNNNKQIYFKKVAEWKRIILLNNGIFKKRISLGKKNWNIKNLRIYRKIGKFKISIWRKMYIYQISKLQKLIKAL